MTTEELEKKLKISKNTCIHCPTFELAKKVLSIFHQLGLKWRSGEYYTSDHNWNRHEEDTVYYPFEGQLSSLESAQQNNYKIISAEEFISLHTEGKEFNLETYEPKGDLVGFPKDIIARMLECQEEQGKKRDVSVFEKDRTAAGNKKGFVWRGTKEDYDFWSKVIVEENFDLFFEKYPKKEETKVCSKSHKVKPLSEFHKRGDTVRSECKECRKQEYQELKNNKNMQENNKKEEDSQEFRVEDKVYDIILGKVGVIKEININDISILRIEVFFENYGTAFYTLEGKSLSKDKYPRLLHYRDDYNYDIIDFNNLPKRQEPKRWRAKEGEIYYFIKRDADDSKLDRVCETKDYYNYISNDQYKIGNYFQTKEEAQEVADELKEYFKQLINK